MQSNGNILKVKSPRKPKGYKEDGKYLQQQEIRKRRKVKYQSLEVREYD